MCALYEEEYTKIHNFKRAKEMCDTLIIIHESSTEVKRNKLSLLTLKYEMFTMDESMDRQSIFGCFQTILNELRDLGKSYDIILTKS